MVLKNENKQYALKLHLSAIAPDTIVVAVVENDLVNMEFRYAICSIEFRKLTVEREMQQKLAPSKDHQLPDRS